MGAPVFAVDQLSLFELDGNAIHDGVAPLGDGDDWETLYNGGGSATPFTGVMDDPAPESIFTGGRKDIQDISQWAHKDGSVPDKSDITNAYAAAYHDNGDLIVYFGADRFDNVGDTFLGFWFFKDLVNALPDGSFSGQHMDGDTLVLVNFPQASNAVPLIQVVIWDSSCSKADSNTPGVGDCAAKNLRLEAGVSGEGAICGSGGDLACAITNEEFTGNELSDAPWSYVSKDGTVNKFPYETFFEGGINLTQIVGGDTCFSSFMAETRSSSSFTAALKDFVLGDFPVCGIDLTKQCGNPRLTANGLQIIYDITGHVENTGFGTVYNIDIADAPPFDAGSFAFDDSSITLASLAGGETMGYSATQTVLVEDNGPSDTVTATANTLYDGTGTTLPYTESANCPPLQISPALQVTKTCSTSIAVENGLVAVNVSFSGDVCNIGDSTISNVTVSDDKIAGLLTLSKDTLDPPVPDGNGGQTLDCATFSDSYFPNEALDYTQNDPNTQLPGVPTTDQDAVLFKDTVTAGGTDVFGDPVTTQSATAECPLCD